MAIRNPAARETVAALRRVETIPVRGHEMTLPEHSQPQYGASTSVCDYIVQHEIRACHPSQVVDFGAGGGKNGRLVRSVLGSECTLIAVEGYERTAQMLREGRIYDRVDTALLQHWIDCDAGTYSLAIFGDVIEHLTPRQIHRALRKCLLKFDHIIIVVPLHDIYQDDAYGNPLEIHRAYITKGVFDRYKPVEKHIVESPGYTMMNVLITARRPHKPLYRQLFVAVFQITILILQPLNLARPFVDLLKRAARRFKWLIR